MAERTSEVPASLPTVEPAGAFIEHPPDGPSRIRGLDLLGAMDYVRKRGGRQLLAGVLRHLSEEDLVRIAARDAKGKRALRPLDWYPFALHCRLLRAIARELRDDDLSILFDVGEHMSSRDVPKVFHGVMRWGRPGWIVDLATKTWRMYHDCGRWELERTPGELIAILHDHDEADEAFCTAFMGWVSGAMRVSGATEFEASHPTCRARGGSRCTFTSRWSVG